MTTPRTRILEALDKLARAREELRSALGKTPCGQCADKVNVALNRTGESMLLLRVAHDHLLEEEETWNRLLGRD